MTEECKKEIEKYLRSNGYDYYDGYSPISDDGRLIAAWFNGTRLDVHHLNKWYSKVIRDVIYYDKYCLEYIGQILRKHKIKEVTVGTYYGRHTRSEDDITYKSDNWIYDEIERVDD